MDIEEALQDAMESARSVIGCGKVADYIPALADADIGAFGLAMATADGKLYGVGDWKRPFSIQSISKVFTLCLVLARTGDVWQRVGREPSGNPFNSLVQLDPEDGVPRNPFINAGAIVVTDLLQTLTGDAFGAVRDFLRAESGDSDLDADPVVAASELRWGHRNAALAHVVAGYGNLTNTVETVLEHYYAHCSITASCADLALASRFLARHGMRADGSRLLTAEDTKRVNAVLLTCGTYDAAGEFAYRVGLPGKSGVGGGVLAVVPGKGTLCAWSPGLDRFGNSIAAVAALDTLATVTGWSVF